METLDILKSIPLLSGLAESLLKSILNSLVQKKYKKNDYIFYEGEEANAFGIVLEGRVKIVKHSIEGKEVIIRIIPEKHIFGEVAMFDNLPYPASAVAMEDSSILMFEKSSFLHTIKKEPSIAWEIIMDLSRKLRDASQTLKEVASERVERRIASLLLRLGEYYGEKMGNVIELKFPLTRQEIADMCGTTVETAIRTMSGFTKDGIIETEKGTIKILAPEALRKVIEGE
jgi:CRP/FNR family transcriptional regulator